MSGGNMDYIGYELEERCGGKMADPELNELLKDFVQVLHDLEWWKSGDISEARRASKTRSRYTWSGAGSCLGTLSYWMLTS